MSLLTGIMWHIGSSVEESVDAVTTVAPHYREAVGLSVLLDDVPQFSIANPRLHCKIKKRKPRSKREGNRLFFYLNFL